MITRHPPLCGQVPVDPIYSVLQARTAESCTAFDIYDTNYDNGAIAYTGRDPEARGPMETKVADTLCPHLGHRAAGTCSLAAQRSLGTS